MISKIAEIIIILLIEGLLARTSYRFTKAEKDLALKEGKVNTTQFNAVWAVSFILGFLGGLIFVI